MRDTASTWSSRSRVAPATATAVSMVDSPGTVTNSAVGSTITAASGAPLGAATRASDV